MIRLGDREVNIKIGDDQIQKVYWGDELIWENWRYHPQSYASYAREQPLHYQHTSDTVTYNIANGTKIKDFEIRDGSFLAVWGSGTVNIYLDIKLAGSNTFTNIIHLTGYSRTSSDDWVNVYFRGKKSLDDYTEITQVRLRVNYSGSEIYGGWEYIKLGDYYTKGAV